MSKRISRNGKKILVLDFNGKTSGPPGLDKSLYFHLKAESRSFPTVYDTPIVQCKSSLEKDPDWMMVDFYCYLSNNHPGSFPQPTRIPEDFNAMEHENGESFTTYPFLST